MPQDPRPETDSSPRKAQQEAPPPEPETRKKPRGRPDPLIARSDLTVEQQRYLQTLQVVGLPWTALKKAREWYGLLITVRTLNEWQRDNKDFADLCETFRAEFADQIAQDNIAQARTGKLSGGNAVVLAQQLNRLRPSEYLPAIQQQIHQTVSYEVEAGFRDEPQVTEPEIVTVQPETVLTRKAPGIQ